MVKERWSPNILDERIVDLALEEDLQRPFCDVTSMALFSKAASHEMVKIISKEPQLIVVCGIPIVEMILKKMGMAYQLDIFYQDSQLLPTGEVLLEISGNPQIILMVERTLLNFLRHLSAIATLTKKFVDAVKGTNLKILDTRKTSPGMRHLEKQAVHCGGGINHRMGLYDAYMVKDTHIDLLGGMRQALDRLPNRQENKLPVIIEVRNRSELELVLKYGRDKVARVLLDNMKLQDLKACVQLCAGVFETEASGNINLETIVRIAETGVNYASIGMLTYAAGQIDLSMQGVSF